MVQATVEAGYLVAQAVLYVCVLYFMAGFDRTAGELFHHPHVVALTACIICAAVVVGSCSGACN